MTTQPADERTESTTSDAPEADLTPKSEAGTFSVELVVFTAPWCQAWRVLERQLGEDLTAMRVVNIDEDAAAADRHNVSVIPTVLARLADRREIRRTGAVSADDLRTLLERVRGV